MNGKRVSVRRARSNVQNAIARSASAARLAISHSAITEVYYVIDGAGTFVTGGTMTNASSADPTGNTVNVLVGPSMNGAGITGGQSRRIGPGDAIVVPPGVGTGSVPSKRTSTTWFFGSTEPRGAGGLRASASETATAPRTIRNAPVNLIALRLISARPSTRSVRRNRRDP